MQSRYASQHFWGFPLVWDKRRLAPEFCQQGCACSKWPTDLYWQVTVSWCVTRTADTGGQKGSLIRTVVQNQQYPNCGR